MNFTIAKKHVSLLLVGLVASSSCATIISGTTQAISIDSNVPGASVSIEGNAVGVTPFSSKIKRQKEAVAMVSAEGYTAQHITLTTSFNPVAVLSIVWDYSTTDCLTGACWEYAPNSYYVQLNPEGISAVDFRHEAALSAFAMTYFGDLQTELAAGSGPKIRSLHETYFPERELDQFVSELGMAPQTSAIDFGEAATQLLRL